MKNNISIIFGKSLQKIRKERKWSQEKFADIIGIHRTYLGAIERGEKNITIITIHKISKALNVSISELFEMIKLD